MKDDYLRLELTRKREQIENLRDFIGWLIEVKFDETELILKNREISNLELKIKTQK
jgi:hypothetical protein